MADKSSAARGLLGTVLFDNANYPKIRARVRQNHLPLSDDKRILESMGRLYDAGRAIDAITLWDDLGEHGGCDARLQAYIGSLTDDLPYNVEDYIDIVLGASKRADARKLLEKAQKLERDPSVPTSALAEVAGQLAEVVDGDDVPLLPPQYSEDELARRLTRDHGDDWRYVASWGKWFHFTGERWVEDVRNNIFNVSRRICRASAAECTETEKSIATRLTSKGTVAATVWLAQSYPVHAATIDQWDSDPWVINTPTGTVCLRTGELHPHRRDHYLTKLTAAGPGAASCAMWMRFLDRITGKDADLQAFLQRMIGYCLTGITREHALFFMYGTGANGKSVFLSTVAGLLGDYAKTAPASAFTASAVEQHPTDLAGLRGARFVTAIETEDGKWWAESKIKSLTGGDRIVARFMRQDFFEYQPQFKLIVAGNHKPGLRNVDEAIRRRLHLVPFNLTIPEGERDSQLTAKLQDEYPGILQWAIEGCLEWQRQGLNPPPIVQEATSKYLAAEDAIGRWIDDCCVRDSNCWTPGTALFASYTQWCERTGERPKSQRLLTQALEARGLLQDRARVAGKQARGFYGIGLRADITSSRSGNSQCEGYAHA